MPRSSSGAPLAAVVRRTVRDMGVLGEMFGKKRIHEDSDAAQGGQQWRLGPIDLENGVVTVGPADTAEADAPAPADDGADRDA